MSQTCPYCGNNPVPHRLFWYNETLNIVLTPLRQKLLYNGVTRFVKRRAWDQKMALAFLFLGESLKIISRQKDVAKCKVRRAQVLWEEAEKRGIVMEELLLFGRPFDTYVATKQQETRDKRQEANKFQTIVFSGLPRPAGYINKWLDLMDDKLLFKQLMEKNNLPVPAGGAATSFTQASRIFAEIRGEGIGDRVKSAAMNPSTPYTLHPTPSVIVKPRSGSRGRHSTTFVNTEEDLKKAFNIARQLCAWVIVEEQLFGPVYRATVINFELAGVLRGDSPEVVGDGVSSITELIKVKNYLPHLGVKDILVDAGVEKFLARQNLALSSAPKNHQQVLLSEKIGVNYGGSSSEDFDICHPDNKELFVAAAKVLGDPIVGFDFIIPDIAKSYKQQKCGFIEVNSLPFINLHHDPLLGKPRNVAGKIWDMLGW